VVQAAVVQWRQGCIEIPTYQFQVVRGRCQAAAQLCQGVHECSRLHPRRAVTVIDMGSHPLPHNSDGVRMAARLGGVLDAVLPLALDIDGQALAWATLPGAGPVAHIWQVGVRQHSMEGVRDSVARLLQAHNII
jgi:hypothetical protein